MVWTYTESTMMNTSTSRITITITGQIADLVEQVSSVFGRSKDDFVSNILDKSLGSKLHLLRSEFNLEVAQLLSDMAFPSQAEATVAAKRFEKSARLVRSQNRDEVHVRTEVVQHPNGTWGVVCDYRHPGTNPGTGKKTSWHPVNESAREL
jgi:hypothetical protein